MADSVLTSIDQEKRRTGSGLSGSTTKREFAVVALIAIAAFTVRLAAFRYFGIGLIESEGAEYSKLAENLHSGAGFVGLASAGPQVLFQMLFPVLISIVSFVVHNYETAGRTTCLLMGSLLPVAIFKITSRLFDRRAAVIAAVLAIFHPVLVCLSYSIYAEGPYATLFLFSVFFSIRAIEKSSVLRFILVGGAFALTYLVRPEGFAAFAITMLFCVMAMKQRMAVRLKLVGFSMLAFLVVALPQVVFLYRSTGKVMLEGRSRVLLTYGGSRMLAARQNPGAVFVNMGGVRDSPSPDPDVVGGYAWEDKWAFWGVNTDLQATGMSMRPFALTVQQTQIRLRDSLALAARATRANAPAFLPYIFSGVIGPLLGAFALVGILRRPWKGPDAHLLLYVALVSMTPVLAICLVLSSEMRYYIIFAPILMIWAANGVLEMGKWIRESSSAAEWKLLSSRAIEDWIAPTLLAAAIVISPWGQVRKSYMFSDSARSTQIARRVGEWIGSLDKGPTHVMGLALPISYHAHAQQHIYFPYCSEDIALRYLDKAKVDYIVLQKDKKFTKYYDKWLALGIPDGRAELLTLPNIGDTSNFVVYRWHWQDSSVALAH